MDPSGWRWGLNGIIVFLLSMTLGSLCLVCNETPKNRNFERNRDNISRTTASLVFYDVWGWSLVCIVWVVVVVTTITKGAELFVWVAEKLSLLLLLADDTKPVCHALPRIERGFLQSHSTLGSQCTFLVEFQGWKRGKYDIMSTCTVWTHVWYFQHPKPKSFF